MALESDSKIKPNSVNISWKEYVDILARIDDIETDNERLKAFIDQLSYEP